VSTYIVPQVLVYQEFNLSPAAGTRTQNAHISGGHAYLSRYAEADEKALSRLGFYDQLQDQCYSWPNRPTGAIVDADYTKVYIDDALLRYFNDAASGGDYIATVNGELNQLASPTLAFKANGALYPHSADFKDRGVRVGDVAKVTCVVGGEVYDLWTYVADFIAEAVAAVVGAASADPNNAATQLLPAPTYAQTAGPENCVAVSSASGVSYDGRVDGDINETYTVTVITSSTGGDATTARLRVTSASGNDDVASVTPAAFGAATSIGTRGLTVTWAVGSGAECSLSATNDDVAADDFIAGQTWEVTVGQAFTATVATSGGTYTGAAAGTYIVEVTRGGAWATSPQITVANTRGTDMSGPTTVTGANTAVTVGTTGVTIRFAGLGLCGSDRFYVVVTPATTGSYNTLVLGHNLAAEVVANGTTEVALELFIRKDIEVSENRLNAAPNKNWEQSATQICLQSGITAYDSTYTDSGVPVALSVYSAEAAGYGVAYAQYRAWLPTLCNDINSIYSVGELDDAISGPLHPDNPLKWGVFKAVSNSNGVAVRYTAVADPNNTDDWLDVLELLDGREDVYGLVPLTRNATVLEAFAGHVDSQSSAESGRWRVTWVNLSVDDTVAVAAQNAEGSEILATISDDPLSAGTQYTLLQVPARDAGFVAAGVQPGDIVRALFRSDGFGGTAYAEYLVDAVLNEDTLRLVSGPDAEISVAEKIEVWHTRTATEKATAVATTAGFSSRRVMAVWPDEVGSGAYLFPGYHLCAALAGLASGVNPHQPLTRVELAGFDNVDRTIKTFNRTQLDIMAGGGTWIVTKDLKSGAICTRQALTTASYDDINAREEMVTRNLDNVSYYFLDLFSPFIGISNVTPSTVEEVRAAAQAGIMELSSHNYVRRLGTQIISGTITDCRAHAVLRDRIQLSIGVVLPYSLNNLELHLVV
jgi:hypothetical protein